MSLCQPSLIEPFGQAALEAMASDRSVVATRIGGPPSSSRRRRRLGRPGDEDALVGALRTAAAMPCPNPAARPAAEAHDVRRQAEKVEAVLEREPLESASLISTSGRIFSSSPASRAASSACS